MRIGVDVGGTNTDAVLLDGKAVLATHKSPTTGDISGGIESAIRTVLGESETHSDAIESVMIGTTQFTNAFVAREGLTPVGCIRLALPATQSLPPYIDWPADIASCIGGQSCLVAGGYEYDGREIAPLDELAVAENARKFFSNGVRAFAICGVFSPVNSAMEERAAEIIQNEYPDVSITLSSKIGRISLLERENAAIMNASLADLSKTVVDSFSEALSRLGITAPFFISQNDGTLMVAEYVKKYPVLTFASGPTNSMRGAASLSGVTDAIVADIGGTTTDIGALVNGFPRESSTTADIGGVRTNFRMPDVFAVGLGGGSVVSSCGSSIGPKSVGYKLTEKAHVFGGNELTVTDMVVAAGYADVGDSDLVANIPKKSVEKAIDEIHRMIQDGTDRMKSSAEPIPLILVGGGSIIVDREIEGTSGIVLPEHASVANAVGASIAQVGGEVDRVYSYEQLGRERSIESAKKEAIESAVAAGADPDSVAVIEFEEVPISYVPGNAVRVRVKVAGDLSNEPF